ncbi:o-succinylbenzoate synthase [Oscillatoria sp. FACHB-1407]|uniref:o-succinylbenzoate synthase n=1 Tax=Oscillatoria sp. FACHB-1407 TaxID=2692847 RepID=UPI00168872C8|nr:o-succinylbenzoate synthase [Oscillatoria sp. FACHB-1407]MBD2459963.1 o-succinylbenzoate synthase [Oscillatoria sp. FACHB-1407]
MRFEFREYSRPFQPPLATSHGVWRDRQGILIRLTDEFGQIGFGEIAPLDWFGSETMAEAIAFCHSLSAEITPKVIFSIPDHLPACQFGIESAWESLQPAPPATYPLECSRLLPTGKAALHGWRSLWQPGCTLKWKIAVSPLVEELALFEQLLQELPQSTKLRLDANGGLVEAEAHQWLAQCQHDPRVEFLEQPLPVDQFDGMVQLSQRYSTPIALDESVATFSQLEACYQRGWRGVFVIKAAIAGSPKRLRRFCQNPEVDVVWSSVFETGVAQDFILNRLISSVSQQQRAIGFGVNHWFTDKLNQLESKAIWQSL